MKTEQEGRKFFNKRQQELLDAAEFDYVTGCSPRFNFPEASADGTIVLPGAYKLSRNGDQTMRRPSKFRDHLVVRSVYACGGSRIDDPYYGERYEDAHGNETKKKPAGGKVAYQFEGWAKESAAKTSVPTGMRRKMVALGIPEKCALNGSSASLQVDHKEGRAQLNGFSDRHDPENYQFLTEHNNQVKRNACKECRETGKRYDAGEQMIMPMSYLEGGEDFDVSGLGCKGCFWHDVKRFKRALRAPNG